MDTESCGSVESSGSNASKTRAPKVTYVMEPCKDTGKLKRVVAMAVSYDKESGDAKYGASIFQYKNPTDMHDKKILSKIATGRLSKKPVYMTLTKDKDGKLLWEDVVVQVRKQIHKTGCDGEV